MNNIGLYIHIPFCLSKCPYCDFYSIPYNSETAYHYKNAVIRNIHALSGDICFDTVYFGGGTPVLLYNEISTFIDELSDKIVPGAEITIEANPGCSEYKKLALLRQYGVNRISFGIQSANEDELKALGRIHSFSEAEKAVYCAYRVGFEGISADIMLGTPHQTRKSVISSINQIYCLPLNHISAYMLKIEPNTLFAKTELTLPTDDEYADIYLSAAELLESNGFMQYEISNFSIPGYESRHNLKYWNSEEYIGIGPAAHSFYRGKRFAVSRDIADFISSPIQKTYITEEYPNNFSEWIMLKLRLTSGVDYNEAKWRFGTEESFFLQRLARIPSNLYRMTDRGFSLTKEGFLVSNAIIGMFI